MIVPVEDADDAEDAEEESSSWGSSSSVLKRSVSSSSPASSKDGEGGAGYSAGLALANCLWRSLMMWWHSRVFWSRGQDRGGTLWWEGEDSNDSSHISHELGSSW
jgi:hypothetical protein